jgi:DNA-binding transcriptional regulator YiaG
MLTLDETLTATHCCEDHATKKLATPETPYHYIGSGIRNVYLVGITYHVCEECGKQAAEIPAIKQLHSALGRALVEKKSPLTGLEVRFLRKRLGKKAIDFASMVSLTPEYLSAVENNPDPVDPGRDKLVRVIYSALSGERTLQSFFKEEVFQRWITSIQKSCIGETLTATLHRNKQWRVETMASAA